VILVSFHGGNGGDSADADAVAQPAVTPYNNLRAYDDNGHKLSTDDQPVLQGTPPTVALMELRGLRIAPNGYLWVASGGTDASEILAYSRQSGTGTVWTYERVVISYDSSVCPSPSPLLHPFDFAFDDDGQDCYVSNQDTDVVARLENMAPNYTSAQPAPLPPSLQQIPDGKFLVGTFVACSVGRLPDSRIEQTTAVAPDPGLCVIIGHEKGKTKLKVLNSVRGVLWINGYLYVADEVARYVKIYGPDGTYEAKSTYIGPHAGTPQPLPDAPVHLMYHPQSQCLCVSCGDSILYASLAGQPTTLNFQEVPNLPDKLTSVSGMTLSPAGDLYVGSRQGLQCWILKGFTPQTGPQRGFNSWPVKDNPEFLLWVSDATDDG
jgi:DNA-binding beta-propeller fold protein YncE